MIKNTFLLSIAMLLTVIIPVTTHADDNRTLSVVNAVVDHLNNYLRTPLSLDDDNVDWDWSIVSGDDISEGCRARSGDLVPLTDTFYDINIYRLAESYHYRVTMDEQVMIRCGELPTVPDGVMPQVIDALADLNARLGMQFAHTSIPWTWRERQFEDYTLGCQSSVELDPRYDRRTNGYIITFTVQGDTWEYRVSSDRLLVVLCDEVEA